MDFSKPNRPKENDMNTGKDLTKKIAKKKLNEVVELDEPKTTHTGGMFDDLEDDLFSNPLDENLGGGSFRKTGLKTYPWQRNPNATLMISLFRVLVSRW